MGATPDPTPFTVNSDATSYASNVYLISPLSWTIIG